MSPDPAAIPTTGFTARTEHRDGITIVVCAGRLTSEHAEKLKKHVRDVIPHVKQVVLDFRDIVRMDSSGLGALVGLYVSAKKANCELLLINYNASVRDLLGITNLLAMFEDCARTGLRIP